MKRIAIFGLSGQIGTALHARLQARSEQIIAYSRQPRADDQHIGWRCNSLEALTAIDSNCSAAFSLGPLDAFAAACARGAIDAPYWLAFGSTSVHVKGDSPDPNERALADRLARAEETLFNAAARIGASVVLLRPTLIWGNGGDRSLTRLVSLARRWRVIALPGNATGLRQPVHCDDLALAALQCFDIGIKGAFDLPGGQTLPLQQMLIRTLQVGAPAAVYVTFPNTVYRSAVNLLAPAQSGLHGFVSRLQTDLTFDNSPAVAAFGYAPRQFDPQAVDFDMPKVEPVAKQ